MVRGTAKFDGIAVGELNINFLSSPVLVRVKAAFISNETGHTHGWTTNEQWSPETMQKLKELRDAMEIELARIHFGAVDRLAAGTRDDGSTTGLWEHLSDGEGRSV